MLRSMLQNMPGLCIKKYRLASYFLIFILIFIVTYFISRPFFGFYIGFNATNPDSARYLLSTLIQSEAAILAIVITLSLVAVQQTASSYSPRVIEVFKNWKSNPDFYLLMLTYLISIVYGVWVLKQIWSDNGNIKNFDHRFCSFEAHIWFCYALGAFLLFSLVPYIRHTLDLLKPSNMIEQISKKISQETIESFVSTRMEISDYISKIISKETTESVVYTGIKEGILFSKITPQKEIEPLNDVGIEKDILLSIEESEEEKEIMKSIVDSFQHQDHTKNSFIAHESSELNGNSDDNPIQQILDIWVSSQIKHDFTTSKYGLSKLLNCIENITEGKISLKFHTEIVRSFEEFAIFSIILKDIDSSFSFIHYLEKIGIKAVEQKIGPVVNIVLNSLNDISIVATEQKMEDIAIWAASSIKNIGINSLNEDPINRTSNEDPFNIIVTGIEMNLRFIGKRASELKLEKETLFIVQFLRDIGKESINNKLIFETRQSVKYLEEIGRSSIRQELEDPITMIGILLDELGAEALKLDPGEYASKKELDEFETLITVCSNFIGNFGKLAAEKNFEYIAENVVTTLRNIGVYVAQRKFILGTTASLSSIKSIGIMLAEQGIDHAVETAVLSLREIGEISIKNNMNDQAIKSLSLIDEFVDFSVRKNMGNSIKSIVLSFNSFGRISIQKNLIHITNGIIISLENIGTIAAKQKMDIVVKNSIHVLRNIAELYINSKNEKNILKTLQSIENLGNLSVNNKLEYSTEDVAISIRDIGSKAIQVKLTQVAYQSKSSLEDILSIAFETKLFNHSIILESLEELNDIINAYDDTTNM